MEVQIPELSVILSKLEAIEAQNAEILRRLETGGKPWLTEEEAQEYTGLKRARLWELRTTGRIVGKVGAGKNAYFRASLDEYMGRKGA